MLVALYNYISNSWVDFLLTFLFAEAPTVTHPTATSVSYNEGSPVNISCTATGKPDPDVKWIHKRQVKSFSPKTAHLTFNKIGKADAGVYTCKANNSAGTKEKQLNIVVNCKYI